LKSWLNGKQLVVIHWIDAASNDDWHNPREKQEAQECVSVGLLLCETEDTITLTHTFGILNGKDCDTCCSLSIPKGCLLAVHEVKEAADKMTSVRKKKCKKQSS